MSGSFDYFSEIEEPSKLFYQLKIFAMANLVVHINWICGHPERYVQLIVLRLWGFLY